MHLRYLRYLEGFNPVLPCAASNSAAVVLTMDTTPFGAHFLIGPLLTMGPEKNGWHRERKLLTIGADAGVVS